MPLTDHQLHHVNVVIAEAQEKLAMTAAEKAVLAEKLGLNVNNFNRYLENVLQKAQAVISSGVFPAGLSPSDIHDLLERVDG